MKKIKSIVFAICIVMMTAGCGNIHKDEATTEEGHTHEETLQLTAYSADYEVFAETSPFVVGQQCAILAHFSRLKDFKPLPAGSVTVSLMVGTDVIHQTLDEMAKPGIYPFSLQPATAGTGSLRFDIKTPEGDAQIIIPDITVYDNEHAAHEAAAAAAITSSNGVTFTKEQSWKVDFATDVARYEPFGQVIRTTAQIQPSQGDEQVIAAKASGTALINTNITEGQTVAAGQTLFTIDGSRTADNNLAVRFAEAESEYNRAKAEYDRKTALAAENIVSQSDLLQAKTTFTNAEAIYNNLRNNFSAGKQSVSSPISGFVRRIMVQNGQHIEAGQPVLVVSQNRNLFIKAELQPKYFDLLQHITTANIRTLNNNRIYSLEALGGRLLSYGKTADVDSPLIPVVFQVNHSADLLAGSFVELFIKTQTTTNAITVPGEAIIEEMGNYFVFVQLTPELFEKRFVKTGVSDGVRIEIKEGLRAGERVVSKGAILIKLSQASGALDAHAGHVH